MWISSTRVIPFMYMSCGIWILSKNALASEHHSQRYKRAARDCKKKYEVQGSHTACIEKSASASNTGISQADKDNIVQKHNDYRSAVSPTASDMMKMSWDDEVAEVAQVWAENCQFEHDDGYNRRIVGRFTVGQNLAQGYISWDAAMKGWHDEVSDFNYGGTATGVVGHYTQMVWATSSKIGCGYASCPSGQLYVCNYSPAGNSQASLNQPYTQGTSCASCSGSCSNNLCDCGKTCENGGDLNLNTCTCSCNKAWYIGDICQLDCSKVDETQANCGSMPFTEANCRVYSNAPHNCPNLCKECPYGSYDYVDTAATTTTTTIATASGTTTASGGTTAVTTTATVDNGGTTTAGDDGNDSGSLLLPSTMVLCFSSLIRLLTI